MCICMNMCTYVCACMCIKVVIVCRLHGSVDRITMLGVAQESHDTTIVSTPETKEETGDYIITDDTIINDIIINDIIDIIPPDSCTG